MRFPSVCYRAVTSITIAMVLLVTASVAHAQSPCTSCPDNIALDTINVDICIGIDTFNLDVVYCHRAYSPPSIQALCSGGLGIDGVTVVQRICASGTALPASDAATWAAVLCKFSPLGGDLIGIKRQIPDAPSRYCWTLTFPRCVQRIGPCIVACDSNPCCVVRWDFSKLQPSGEYIAIGMGDCNQNGSCSSACTDIGCTFNPSNCDDCP